MSLIDPIDRNALMIKLGIVKNCEACKHHETVYCSWKPNVVDVCEAICDAPTIDPVMKGGWVHGKLIYSDISIAICTICGKRVPVGNFCKNCGSYNGAKMEGCE